MGTSFQHVIGRLSPDQEEHLCRGLAVDPDPWSGKLKYPFRGPDHRREVWGMNRDYLMAKYPDCDLSAAADYDGEEVDPARFPKVWNRPPGGISAPRLTDVVRFRETEH